jgi:ATPase subunit of ABC transporter with duplicated ATPase domains
MQIRLQKVSYGYTVPLFEDVDLTITEKDKIGIVGNNGEGKSTLLKCIAGIIPDYEGEITKPKNLTFGFIEQDVPDDIKGMSLFDAIASKIPEHDRDYNLWKVDITLDTFKAPENIRKRAIKDLSGGWQRLALIARVSMSNPDILLLDEPTNHLDVGKILVLEEWLKTQVFDTPMIVISHDRGFLESCTNRTVFLRDGQVTDYKYPYSRARKLLFEDDKAAKNQREIELAELERLQKSAHHLRQIGVDNYSAPALKKAKQIERKIERLRSQVTSVYVEQQRDIKLSSSETHAKRLVLIENTDIKAPDGTLLFHIEKLEINQGDRLVILGPNGAGKSQFIQHLKRAFANIDIAKKQGISITPSAKLGYVDQHLSNLPLHKVLKDYVFEASNMDHQKVTSTLVSIGFPYDTQEKKIKDLSQGQRARLNLLILRLTNPNFYIMDEPTNHLDIAGQEALEREILEHGAASLIVSHDRAFIANLGTKFFEIYRGKLREVSSPQMFYESLNDVPFENAVSKNIDVVNNTSKNLNENKSRNDKNNSSLAKENELKKLKTDLEKSEVLITKLENEIKALDIKINDPLQFEQLNKDANFFTKYNELKDNLDKEMKIWENISEKLSQ